MADTMKALVLDAPDHLTLREIPKPMFTSDDQVLVQVMACGICGSDLRYIAGENPWASHTLGVHVPNPPGMVLGHEFSGIVVDTASSDNAHLIGKPVGAQAFKTCGTCALCRTGRENLCADTMHIGHAQGWGEMDFYPGAYAQFCLAWADLVYELPNEVTFAQSALRDIIGVAVHAAGRGNIGPDDSVLCIGAGPAGLSIALCASNSGCQRSAVRETADLPRTIAEDYDGVTLDDGKDTGSYDVVFDTVGSAETVELGLTSLTQSGRYVTIAPHDMQFPFNMQRMGSERMITTSANALYSDEREAHRLICSGEIDVSPMITHRFSIDEFESAFLTVRERRGFKVIIEPNG